MEIQQREKESLSAYIYHFKRDAKRCYFMNNATIISIFVKGLKNAHNVAAHIYEKGPQTLTDAISEVKKLHATQQLTATLIPSSKVNVMSHEEDCCFQCQASGHIACHCPNVCCFECSEYGHIVVDCPHRIRPLVHLHIIIDCNPGIDITTAQPHATIPQIGTESPDLDHDHTTEDTAANVTINPLEHILGYTTVTTGDIAGVVHTNSIQTLLHITLTVTPCIKDPPLIEAHQPIHKIAADHALGQPTGQLRKPHIRIHPIPEDPMEIHTIRGIHQSP